MEMFSFLDCIKLTSQFLSIERRLAESWRLTTFGRIGAVFVLIVFAINGSSAQTCNCKEYVYVNEPSGVIHKMEVDAANGVLTEVGGVNGIPWLNNPGVFPFPHGLGVDRNGYLFIGTNFSNPNSIRKLDCTGNLFPETGTTGFRSPPTGDWGFLLTNIASYDGLVYANGPDSRIYKIDPCTGQTIGFVQLANSNTNDWGLYIDDSGRFYATEPGGRIYAFTPTAADFISNTSFNSIVNLGSDPTQSGLLSPAYANQGLQGIVTDPSGDIYVVEGNRDAFGTPSRLLKFTSTGTFIAAGPIDSNGSDNMGWNQMVGIIYSSNSNKLYTTSLNPNEDCIYRWNTDLTPDGEAVGPVPNPLGQCKAIGILSECCPQSATLSTSVCGAQVGDRISLSELLACEGVICEGQWAEVAGSSNLSFNECDLTVTLTGLPACGEFTITNTGVTGGQCAPYTIEFEINYLAEITAQVVGGGQTVCSTDDPMAFTVATPASTTQSGATIMYQWQSSTTSCMDGFTDIVGANSETYDPGPVSQTTYFRVIASIEGCTSGECDDVSNCVILTVDNTNCTLPCTDPSATLTPTAATCTGSTANNDGTITLAATTNATHYGVSLGATYTGPTTIAGATAIPGTLPVDIITNAPNAGATYVVRLFNGADDCFVEEVVMVAANICVLPCIDPTATLTTTPPTCTSSTEENNGTISLDAVTNATHYGISSAGAATYDGPMTIAAATAVPGTLPATILSNAPNAGATYIVRIFNGADDCFVEETVVVEETIVPTVEAGMPQTLCSTAQLSFLTLGASITPAPLGGMWTTSGDGQFLDGLGNPLSGDPSYLFGEVAIYIPGPTDIMRGEVTLTLTTFNPDGPCDAVSDAVLITILKTDCGSFPWGGN